MLLNVKRSKILPPRTSLRPVLRDSLEFAELVESIREHGLLNSICITNHPTQMGYYEIIDGNWRFEACKFLDFSEIDAILKEDVTDEQILSMQIHANSVSYATRPIEFAEQMQTMVEMRESIGSPINLIEMGKLVGHSSNWVRERLSLNKLCPAKKDLLKEGKLTLGKAIALSRIHDDTQDDFYEKHKHLNNRQFELAVGEFINECRQVGSAKIYRESPLRPRLQSVDNLVIELDTMEVASQLIVENNAQTAIEGAKLILEWVLNLHKDGLKKRSEKITRGDRFRRRLEIIRRQRYEELEGF